MRKVMSLPLFFFVSDNTKIDYERKTYFKEKKSFLTWIFTNKSVLIRNNDDNNDNNNNNNNNNNNSLILTRIEYKEGYDKIGHYIH